MDAETDSEDGTLALVAALRKNRHNMTPDQFAQGVQFLRETRATYTAAAVNLDKIIQDLEKDMVPVDCH